MSLAEGRRVAAAFLSALPRAARLVVFCHFDADGLAAGALFGRALARLGFTDVRVVPSRRGESAFSDGARTRLAVLAPDALIVTDLGVNRAGVLPGVPTLYVDHHRPEGEPAGAAVVCAYGWEHIPSSSELAFELLAPLADMDDLDWIAAVGAMSDYGDSAAWPRLPAVKKRHTAKWLREAVSLVNAARRASAFDVETPLRLLLEVDGPRALAGDDARGADRLRAHRAEVKAAMDEARKRAPVFSRTRPLALVMVDSPCQVHPLIAQQWAQRLPKYAAISANVGYLPGLVSFSVRTSRKDLDVPTMLRTVDLGEHNASFGFGHDQASGGNLPPGEFERLLSGLGFS